MENHPYGDQEMQVSEGEEVDLHKHRHGCKKNPGHAEFIPVDTFTLNHLPEYYRDSDFYELLKDAADMTVRVDVKMISPRRPEFWPDTKAAYPFYNMGDKTIFRVGTGKVDGVYKFNDGLSEEDGSEHWLNHTKCWCKKCQRSDTASHVWWEFYVFTATHVVFDDIEADHTSLRLFFDKENCPKVSVDRVCIVNADIASDRCMLNCVTCDENLAEKLNKVDKHLNELYTKVNDKYKKSRSVDKLNIILSHPHGCPKHVSVGHWVDIYKVDKDNDFKFTYSTCTCPGSSGAPVYCVGCNEVGRWLYQLVHSGSLKSKLNYSGAGSVN